MDYGCSTKVVVGIRRNASSTLLIPGVRTIVLALLAMGVIGGSIDVAVVAFANAQGWPESASFILADYALGSMIAGLTFGVLRVSLPIEKQFFIGVLVTSVTAVLTVFSPNVYILSGMLFVVGVSFAPTMIIVMNLGTIIVPPSRITEGLTWMTTGFSIGVALGSILAGIVVDVYGARTGFGVAIVAGLVMVVVVLLGLRTLRATSAVSPSRSSSNHPEPSRPRWQRA
ncbi:Major facilitator superfamily MFS_1 (fragment) [Xenorhabdus bovienii str. oregonense]|uniref:Major facilitator superfamily MFS_1 n=1 Tax=Xenorhabdus bovienii str. oregonense TaxID=1398202 RepID=A0A077P4I8_XENBV